MLEQRSFYYKELSFNEESVDMHLKLYERSFGSSMDRALWMWKYGEGRGRGVSAFEDERAIAYYGAIERSVYVNGYKRELLGVSDTMVEPSKRGVFSKNGVFSQIAKKFISDFSGSERAYSFCFGFPSQRHAKLGEKLGYYSIVDTLYQFLWKIESKRESFFYAIREITEDELEQNIPKLWSDMSVSFCEAILGEKSFEFIKWRYLKHPLNKYKSVALYSRFFNRVKCVIIFREHKEDGSVEIMDVIGSSRYFNSSFELLFGYFYERGFSVVYIWATKTLGNYLPIERVESEVCSVCVTNYGLESVDDLKGRWLMSGGESDFR